MLSPLVTLIVPVLFYWLKQLTAATSIISQYHLAGHQTVTVGFFKGKQHVYVFVTFLHYVIK